MASKRQLKKSINNLTYDLVSECFTYRHFHPEKNNEAINEIIQDLVKTRNDLIAKVNQIEDGSKKSYQAIVDDMKAMVNKLDKISTLK